MSRSVDLNNKVPMRVVVLVLENSQGDVLLTQRQKHQHLAGYWEFPGGKIEPNESAIEALSRECLEELDYLIKSPQHILTINHSYPDIDVSLLVFHDIADNPQVKPVECQPLQWVRKPALLNHRLPEANQAIVEYLCN